MKYDKEILNKFLTEKVAIALPTQEEWNEFMELLESETDLVWESGNTPTELNYWEDYKEETAITNNFKHSDLDYRGLGYGDVSTYKSFVYEIIEFKELVKDDEINLADKLKFLADRMKDEKEFYICGEFDICRFRNFKLMEVEQDGTEIYSSLSLNYLLSSPLRLKPQWTFTEDEKVILRNLPEEYKWIARDKDGGLGIYDERPLKADYMWVLSVGSYMFNSYRNLFQSIQWSDEESCEFRKYL